MLTTAEDLEFMAGTYHAQRGRHPGVAMCPATWAIVSILFPRLPHERVADSSLRVVVAEQHDPCTITFFDDDEDATRPPAWPVRD